MKTKVGFIPLDSRPCNFDWIINFAKLARIDILTLPKEQLGTLHTKLNYDDIVIFLKDNASKFDYLIIPIDAIISGGLIQSRNLNCSVNEATEKLKIISEVKKLNPTVKIYCYDTVLRTSISTFDETSKQNWHLINEYSKYKGLYHQFNNPSDEAQYHLLEQMIPDDVLKSYLKARESKHKINLLCLELLKNKYIDFLILLQEDSMENGIQTLEHQILNHLIDEFKLNEHAFLYNGTDEAGCLLLAKIVSELYKKTASYYLLTTDIKFLNKVQPFEDRPYLENFKKMCTILNLYEAKNIEDADFVLAIYLNETIEEMTVANREKPQQFNHNVLSFDFITNINNLLNSYNVFFLDISVPNGGIYEMLKHIDFLKLKGYSAWNTASNATGSILTQALIYVTVPQPDESLNNMILQERIIDDCFYQDVVRSQIHRYLRESNINIFDFKGEIDLEPILNENLNHISNQYFKTKYRAYFPWYRAFEIGLIFKKE